MPAPLVAHGREEIAHLGQHEQSFVVRVVMGEGVDEIDVLGGRETLDPELPSARTEPGDHQRMEAAEGVILEEAALGTGGT